MKNNIPKILMSTLGMVLLFCACPQPGDPDLSTYIVTYDANGANSGTAPTDSNSGCPVTSLAMEHPLDFLSFCIIPLFL
jgi:hypothetical protein